MRPFFLHIQRHTEVLQEAHAHLLVALGLTDALFQQGLRYVLTRTLPALNPTETAREITERLRTIRRRLIPHMGEERETLVYVEGSHLLAILRTEGLELTQHPSPSASDAHAMELLKVAGELHEQHRLLYDALERGDSALLHAAQGLSRTLREALSAYRMHLPRHADAFHALTRAAACLHTLARLPSEPGPEALYPERYFEPSPEDS